MKRAIKKLYVERTIKYNNKEGNTRDNKLAKLT